MLSVEDAVFVVVIFVVIIIGNGNLLISLYKRLGESDIWYDFTVASIRYFHYNLTIFGQNKYDFTVYNGLYNAKNNLHYTNYNKYDSLNWNTQ